MILVTVHLLPGGSVEFRRAITSMAIANVSDLAERSDYRVKLFEDVNPISMTAPRSTVVTVQDHDRRSSVWVLIEKAIGRSLASFDR